MDVSQLTEDAVGYVQDMFRPTVRLGMTGLSRAGKTVFITALVHNLLEGGWLAFFDPAAENRLLQAHLKPPDPAIDLFNYEHYMAVLTASPPDWPERTNSISELRLALNFRPAGGMMATFGPRTIYLDIVDYPGEWLLDLPLLEQSYSEWAQEALALARTPLRRELAADWLDYAAGLDARAPHDTEAAIRGSELFKNYLRACRQKSASLSLLPPGRFLEPGAHADKPLMNFLPLDVPTDGKPPAGSLWAEMVRWYEAYKAELVVPFFREHFARLDRQIVLVDTLRALNAGPGAVDDLEQALSGILGCFRQGGNTLLSRLFAPRIDRVLFAATKADHLHSEGYDRLRAIMARLTERAMKRAAHAGAEVGVESLAAVRATRQAGVDTREGRLGCIVGVPMPGETIAGHTYDGATEAVVFPGALPADPEEALSKRQNIRFVRFRPPASTKRSGVGGRAEPLPHIRLDRALQFLLADRMR